MARVLHASKVSVTNISLTVQELDTSWDPSWKDLNEPVPLGFHIDVGSFENVESNGSNRCVTMECPLDLNFTML